MSGKAGLDFNMNGLSYSRAGSYESVSQVSEYDTDIQMDGGLYPGDLEYDASIISGGFRTPKLSLIRNRTTSIGTKIKNIEDRNSRSLSKKKKIKNNRSIKDWWHWYWQHPLDHFPFLYFFGIFLSCFAFSVYWYMDSDSCFILCGIIGLIMCVYAARKFRDSINIKKEVDKYKKMNVQFRRENRKLEAAVIRTIKAHTMLRQTRARIAKANASNRRNLKKFKEVEKNMQLVGKKASTNLNEVNKMTHQISEKWRNELLHKERDMLHAVFDRYERRHPSKSKSKMGMTQEDFNAFQGMLPKRYKKRFDRLGTFHHFAGIHSMIDEVDFANTLDTFALMETDDKDIEFILTPSVKPMSHEGSIASFQFETRDIMFSLGSPQLNYKSPQLSPLMSPARSPLTAEKYVHFNYLPK